MKVLIKEEIGRYADGEYVNTVHLDGPVDTTACGLADEDYIRESTHKKLTCSTCIDFLKWAKKVSKIKQ